MTTLINWFNSMVVGICLIAIGIGALWAWGAYVGVAAKKEPVVLHDRALQTLAELDRDVKQQAITLEQARKEYALLKSSLKKSD